MLYIYIVNIKLIYNTLYKYNVHFRLSSTHLYYGHFCIIIVKFTCFKNIYSYICLGGWYML